MLWVLALCFSLQPSDHKAPFLLQLQKAHYENLAALPFGIAVVDWEDSHLTPDQIKDIKAQGKTLVSYLSIGEAENYRNYWKKSWQHTPPPFLDKENPDWPGNYKVRYWDKSWQGIIEEKLKQIVTQGYNGVYFDIVDAYWYYQEKGRKQAQKEMVDFIIHLSRIAKAINPHFLIIPQNAPELVADPTYLAAIDGLGKEDTWYHDNEPLQGKNQEYELHYLRQAKQAGKFILATDYPTSPEKQKDFIQKATTEGFIPFVGTRALDKGAMPWVKCN